MPLIKSTSKQAFGENIARERAAGKPIKQAVAIAYSERRSAQKDSHHSSHSARRSEHYHARVVEPVRIDRGANKMTRAVRPMMNDEDDTASTGEAYRG